MEILRQHPHWTLAVGICKVLAQAGYQTVFAGGCVRDALLGIAPKDLDIATEATPEIIEDLFPNTVPVGKAFGVMVVVEKGIGFEVATFRKDGDYSDGRHPDSISFASLKEDALRRDFTVNALFYDPSTEEIYDFVEGQRDLLLRLIRTVGEAHQRFTEDSLRLLRAVRFGSQLGFEIESQTLQAVSALSTQLSRVSSERIFQELQKLLLGHRRRWSLKILWETGLIHSVFPKQDVDLLVTVQKNCSFETKSIDLFTQDPVVAWCLFFLIFNPHAQRAFEALQTKLVFPTKTKKGIEFCLRELERIRDVNSRKGERLLALSNETYGASLQQLRVEFSELQPLLKSQTEEDLESLKKLITLGGSGLKPFLNGEDLIQAQIKKGPLMGSLLKESILLQIEGHLKTREEALNWLRAYTSNGV
ncbi:MAG: CCA tRNA nucleotidyltransferase [Bdellovibrionales bacterium]|nr:CCA tRNA nucleotidyltransferase [Bdellovibrionales bacterium]